MKMFVLGLMVAVAAPASAQLTFGLPNGGHDMSGDQPYPGHEYEPVATYRKCLAEKSAALAKGNQEGAETVVEVASQQCQLEDRVGFVMIEGERNVRVMEHSAAVNAMGAVMAARQ